MEGTIEGFDYRATVRDPKTGKVVKDQPYFLHISQAHGTVLERGGKFFAPNGVEIQDPRKKITSKQIAEDRVEHTDPSED